MTSLSELLTDHEFFHSNLQMDSFITIRAGGTVYGCYKQALRELQTRITALRGHRSTRALLEVEIEEHEAADSRRDRIHASTKRAALAECDRVIADTIRELTRFYGQADALRSALVKAGESFPLESKARDRLDREMWGHQIKCRAAVEFLSSRRLQSSTIELFQALPAIMRQQLADEIFNEASQNRLIHWYMTFEPEVPAPTEISEQCVRGLLECSGSYDLPKP
jgi:hypothetical protein